MKFGPRELLVFAIVLLVPVLSYAMVFRPQNAEIGRAQTEIRHKQDMLEQLRAETSRNADLIRANEEIGEKIREIEARLPSTKEVDQIVRQISVLAIEAGLAPPTLKSNRPISAAHYLEQPLEISTQGSFDGFYRFLLALERLPRVTRISEMNIRPGRERVEIVVDFTLSIYFREEEGDA